MSAGGAFGKRTTAIMTSAVVMPALPRMRSLASRGAAVGLDAFSSRIG